MGCKNQIVPGVKWLIWVNWKPQKPEIKQMCATAGGPETVSYLIISDHGYSMLFAMRSVFHWPKYIPVNAFSAITTWWQKASKCLIFPWSLAFTDTTPSCWPSHTMAVPRAARRKAWHGSPWMDKAVSSRTNSIDSNLPQIEGSQTDESTARFSYADTSSTMSHSLVTSTFNCEDKSLCICRLLLKSSRLCSMASTRRSCIGETSDCRSTNTAVAPFGMWAISFPRSKTCLRLGPNHIDLWFNDPKARSKWLTISANLFEILQMAHCLRMSTNEHRQPLDAAAMKRSELGFAWL